MYTEVVLSFAVFIVTDNKSVETIYTGITGIEASSCDELLSSVNLNSNLSLLKATKSNSADVYLVYEMNTFYSHFMTKIHETVHEIKNSLTMVVSSTLMIMKMKKKDKLVEKDELFTRCLGDVDISVQNIITILNKLKHIDENQEKIYIVKADTFIYTTEAAMKLFVSDSNIKAVFNNNLLSDKKFLKTCGIALNQVVINLIKNSVFSLIESKIKKPELVVDIVEQDEFLIFSVTDNGSGISEENRTNIFKGGFTTKGDKGSGVGLALCRKYLEMSGGSIHLDEDYEQGARFVFKVPLTA